MSKEFSKKDIPPTIALACIIIPVLMGYRTFGLGYYGWIALSSAASAFAMYCHDRQRPVLSIITGILMGLGVFMATQWYFEGRSHYLQIEILIPLVIGIVPGGLIYLIGKSLIKKPAVTPSNPDPLNYDEQPKRTDHP